MKKLLVTLLSALSLVLLSGPALASHPWDIRMSDPTTSNQVHSFNIEYSTLSTDGSDQITVSLIETAPVNQTIGTQVTQPGGNAGTFSVTVPTDGTYTYHMRASSSVDGSTKDTADKTVTVTTPANSQTSVITVTQPTGGNGGGAGTGATAVGTTVGTNSQAAGGTNTTGTNGQVSNQAASTNNPNAGVLGAQNTISKRVKNNLGVIIPLGIVALGLLYYLIFARRGGRS